MPAGLGLAERRMDLAEVAARRGQAAALDAALRTHLGVGLPAPGRTSTHGDVAALWIAPETALVMAPPAGLAGLRAAIAPALGAVVDQGSGFAVLRLDGPRAAATLARGCRIDLARSRPAGSRARSSRRSRRSCAASSPARRST
jgi:sarcosine oxidase subunit gamma